MKIASEEIKKSNGKYIVLYAYEVHAVEAAKKLSELYNIPFISRFQGTILENVPNTMWNRLKKYPHFQALSQKSDLIIMTDDGTSGLKVLEKLNNKTSQIEFLKNGVNILSTANNDTDSVARIKERLCLNQKDFIFLTVSRLVYWKRLDRAIVAISKLKKQHIDCKLIIVGEGNERIALERLVRKKNVEDYVIFVGGVDQNEIGKYYVMSDVFLSLYDFSNVGNPLLEALMHGKPIITLNNGNTSQIIKNNYNGILIPIDHDEMIAEAMIRLKEHDELRDRLSYNALDYAKKNLWSWEQRMDHEYKIVIKMLNKYYEGK